MSTGEFKSGDAQGDTLVSIENLEGSRLSDRLVGDRGRNVLSGLEGNDYLRGLNGQRCFRRWSRQGSPSWRQR
ncbi:MAG: hypothetical protein HC881_15650 [Leptolyngbyaceae cyanobacterium SL_7_1]|nr:hypothetical protein [Leptolyngbyaceae cyanobacterium SL_7_1]